MAKLSTLVKRTGESTVIFGPPKVGKTRLAAMLSQYFRLTWFDLENGIKTAAAQLPIEWQENIEVIQLPDTKENPCAIQTLLKVFTGAPCMICEEHGKVACPICTKKNAPQTRVCLRELNAEQDIVVIDSGTQLTSSALFHVLGTEKVKAEWDDWGAQGQLLSTILTAAQQAHYNTLFITHEVEGENEDGTKKIAPAFGTRNFAISSAKFFSNVVYAKIRAGDYVHGADVKFDLSVVAGNRAGLKLEKGKVELVDLIRSNFQRKTAAELGLPLPSILQKASVEVQEKVVEKEPASIKPVQDVPVTKPVQVIGDPSSKPLSLKERLAAATATKG